MTGMTMPKLRFSGFKDPWKPTAVSTLLDKQSVPVAVDLAQTYRQIGVRSHGKGIFHKEAVTGTELGEKRVFHVVPDALVVNIVFAWEQAVALTSDAEAGFVASHRFPMFTEKGGKSYLPFLRQMFLTKRGKLRVELASPGGAGRNKTLGQQEFLKLKPVVPTRAEQKKIADAIGAVDAKLAALAAKQAALVRFKAGLMQKLFSQQLRFAQDDGQAFPNWEEKRLGKLGKLTGGGTPDTNNVSYWDGDIPWISSSDILENDLSGPRITRFINDKALKDSATKIVPANSILIVSRVGVGKLAVSRHDVCTSQDFTSFTPSSDNVLFLGFWMLSNTNALLRLCQGTSIKGLTSNDLKSLVVPIPHPDEQQKIADALSAMDAKIQAVADQISKLQTFKKGLLQQMFV